MSFLDEAKDLSGGGLLQKRGGRSRFEKRQARWGWLFISPWIIGFLVFYLFPILASLAFSFTDFDPRAVDETQWVGLKHWRGLWGDRDLQDALKTTLTYMAVALPIAVVFPILLAAFLNMKQLVGKRLFTTLFYIPFMVPAVAALVVWRAFLNPKTGWLNRLLEWYGFSNMAITLFVIVSVALLFILISYVRQLVGIPLRDIVLQLALLPIAFFLGYLSRIVWLPLTRLGRRLFGSLGETIGVDFLGMVGAVLIGSVVAVLIVAMLFYAKQALELRFRLTSLSIPLAFTAFAFGAFWLFERTTNGWLALYNAESGPGWLVDAKWVVWGLILIGLWGVGNAMLITLAGMQGVPSDLYEAGRLDGAGPIQLFWNITIPMITPVIFYNLILSVVGLFRYFDIPYILSEGTGKPDNAMWFFNIHFYKKSFVSFDFGYGAALAWLLFFIAFAVTTVIFITSKWWVYSPGGD